MASEEVQHSQTGQDPEIEAPIAGPAVEQERPLRPFGVPASQANASRWNGLRMYGVISAGLVIAGVAGYMALSPVTKPKAPAIKLSQPEAGAGSVVMSPAAVAPEHNASASLASPASSAVAASAASHVEAASAPQEAASSAVNDEMSTTPKSLPEALVQLQTLREQEAGIQKELDVARLRIADLESERKVGRRTADVKSGTTHAKRDASSKKTLASDDFVAVSVLDIGEEGVLVSDSVRKYKVRPGGQLPGGATYIGYDPATHLMKTNQGDFQIP